MSRIPIQLRLAAGFALAMAIVLTGAGIFVYTSLGSDLARALDQDLLFYLKARGIPAKEAEALLIQAFIGEAVEGLEHAGLRDALMDQVAAWLKARE